MKCGGPTVPYEGMRGWNMRGTDSADVWMEIMIDNDWSRYVRMSLEGCLYGGAGVCNGLDGTECFSYRDLRISYRFSTSSGLRDVGKVAK